jgi:crossover junction endodeoxyribonuclease RuvC
LNITALDLSLTSTGVADEDGVRTITSKLKGMARIAEILERIVAISLADLFVIEDYAFQGGHDAYAHALGELGGVVRFELWRNGVPYVDVGVSNLKKYATGKGNAKKELMLAEAIRRLDYQGASNDEADALWLREMALDHYGLLEKSQRAALNVVKWPEMSA